MLWLFMIWVIYINMVEEYRLIWNWRMNIIEKHLQGSWRFMKEKIQEMLRQDIRRVIYSTALENAMTRRKVLIRTMQRQGNGMKRL